MKKLLIIALCCFCCITATRAEMPIRWGALGGININNSTKAGGNVRQAMYGYHFGAKMEAYLSPTLYFDTSVLFTSKPIKLKETEIERQSYSIEIPMHLATKVFGTEDFSFFMSGGPYVGMGLHGSVKQPIVTTNEDGSTKTEIEKTSLYVRKSGDKRFEMGLGARVGIELVDYIQISLSYHIGLTKLNKYNKDFKHRNLMVSVGYVF